MAFGAGSAACESEPKFLPSPDPANKQRHEDSTSGESDSSSGETKDPRSIIHEYQYGSDEEEYEVDPDDGMHEMTRKEFRDYQRQINESDGFEVMSFPKTFSFGMIIPVYDSREGFFHRLQPFSELALVKYNEEKNTNLKFVKVVKATMEVTGGLLFYITFDARGADGCDLTLQAKVFEGFPDIEVVFCRLEPQYSIRA